MIDKLKIFELLKARDFELIEEIKSAAFGNYSDTFSNNIINIRFVSDRSVESIDIKSCFEENWYDLNIIQLFVEKRIDLKTPINIQESIDFLGREIDLLSDLFNSANYNATKNVLDKLKIKRAKEAFPWYKE